MLRKAIAWLIALALLAAPAVPALAEVTRYGTMMVDNCEEWVSLRDGPGTGCGRLAKVPLFALVTDAEWEPICGDFIYCNYNGQYGYILSKYLVPWADPEPDPDARFESEWGFAFDYDASLMTVDTDDTEGGQSLIVYPEAVEAPVYLEIMTAEKAGMLPSRFLEVNAPADVTYEESQTADGSPLHWFQTPQGEVARVYYAVDGAQDGLVAVGTCPIVNRESWIAQFNAIMRSIAFVTPLPVRADWAEATGRALVVDQDGEYVTIMADAPVSDVALLALTLTDCDEDGNAAFDEAVVHEQDALVPDAPLVVKLAFPGDMPCYGLRFTDGDGEVRRFAFSVSGLDGSLRLAEY